MIILYKDKVREGQFNIGWMSVVQYPYEIYNPLYEHLTALQIESLLKKDFDSINIFESLFPNQRVFP